MSASHRALNAAGTSASRSARMPPIPVTRPVFAGVIGGLGGGMVFGVLKAMMGMLPMRRCADHGLGSGFLIARAKSSSNSSDN